MIFLRVTEAILILLPALEEEVLLLSVVSPSLEDRPTTTPGLHVAPHGYILPSYKDGVEAALRDGFLLHQI